MGVGDGVMGSHHDYGVDCEMFFGGTPDDIEPVEDVDILVSGTYKPRQLTRMRQGFRSVTEIALDVHCANTGSGEWFSEYDEDVQLLKDILATWEESKYTTKNGVHWKKVEDSIRAFVQAVVDECEWYAKMRKSND